MYCTENVVDGLKKSAKNWGSQWCAQSFHCAHTGHIKGNVGSLDDPTASQLFTFGPEGQDFALKML